MSATRRLQTVTSHLQPHLTAEAASASFTKKPDDIVVVSALRSPIGKAKRGSFKDTHPGDLVVAVIEGVLKESKVKPEEIGDVIFGNVLLPGAGAAQIRMATFLANLPENVPVTTLNRQCSSGLQAFANSAAAIQTGVYEIGLSGGVESMSKGDMMAIGDVNPKVFENEKARDCLYSMGETSENVAAKFNISREVQDRFAVESYRRASAAIKAGHFKKEIVPVTTTVTTAEGEEKTVTVSQDEGPRETTFEQLSKLKPSFKPDGSTTAGNSSQVSDGAAAVLAMKRSEAEKRGLPILGVFRSYAVVGVPPAIMGIGPAVAIPEALKKAGITVDDVDVFEINEAFASQATYCVEHLKIDPKKVFRGACAFTPKVNPTGGAIALGHPLGCTGARQIATLLHGLQRTGQNTGVISMCIGTGMGAAAVFTRE